MRSVRPCILTLALLSLTSAACATPRITTGPAQLSRAPTPQPAAPAASFPRGRFRAVPAPNMVVMAIENDGQFRLYVDNDLLDSGRFEVAGPQVLVDSLVCEARGDKPAAYDWLTDDEGGLAFRPVAADPCPERQQYLSAAYQPKYMLVFDPSDDGA